MTKQFQSFVPASIRVVVCVLSAQTPGTGRVHIKNVQSYSGHPPLSKPRSIVVYNFAATPEEVE
jgi:hypothetical protein